MKHSVCGRGFEISQRPEWWSQIRSIHLWGLAPGILEEANSCLLIHKRYYCPTNMDAYVFTFRVGRYMVVDIALNVSNSKFDEIRKH